MSKDVKMEETKHQVLRDLTDVFPHLPESVLLEVIVDNIEPNEPLEPERKTLVQSCVDQLLDTSRFLFGNGDSQQNNNKSLSSLPEDGKRYPIVVPDHSDNEIVDPGCQIRSLFPGVTLKKSKCSVDQPENSTRSSSQRPQNICGDISGHVICDSDNMFDLDLTSPGAYSSDSISNPLVSLGLDRNNTSGVSASRTCHISTSTNAVPQQASRSMTIPTVTDINTTIGRPITSLWTHSKPNLSPSSSSHTVKLCSINSQNPCSSPSAPQTVKSCSINSQYPRSSPSTSQTVKSCSINSQYPRSSPATSQSVKSCSISSQSVSSAQKQPTVFNPDVLPHSREPPQSFDEFFKTITDSSKSRNKKSISAENNLASSKSLTTNSFNTSNSVSLSTSSTSGFHTTSSQSSTTAEVGKVSDIFVNLTPHVPTSRPTANKTSAIGLNLAKNCVGPTSSSAVSSNLIDVMTKCPAVKNTNCVGRTPSSTVTSNPPDVMTGRSAVQNLNQTEAVSPKFKPNCISPSPSSKPFNVKTSRITLQDTNQNSSVRQSPIPNSVGPSTSSNVSLNPPNATTSKKTVCKNLVQNYMYVSPTPPSTMTSNLIVINISDDEDKNSSITTLNKVNSISPIKQNSQQRNANDGLSPLKSNVIESVVLGHFKNEDKKSSKEDVAVLNLVEEGDEDIHSSLQTVLDIFPDADRNWVENQLKAIKTQDPTNYSQVVCNTMFDSPYKKHRTIEIDESDNNLLLLSLPKKHTAKTKHLDKAASCFTLDSSQQTLNTTMSLEINRKRKADEDMSLNDHSSIIKYVKKEDDKSVNNQDDVDTSSSTPMDCDASNATTDEDCCPCESCHQFYNLSKLGQCCEGHLLCPKCIWEEIKPLLNANSKKLQIECKVKDCTSFMSIGELKRIVPGEIMELFNEILEKENENTINKLENIVRCPECGFTAELLQIEKEFHCGNPDCMLSSCRYCKKSWNDDSHTHCTALLTLVDRKRSDGVVTSCPKYWKDIEVETDKDFCILPLEKKHEEYRAVKDLMLASMSQTLIKSIYRIQNNKLWEKYYLSRKHICDDFGAQKLNERHLFHGTNPQNIQQICQQGFDWRLSGKQVGAAYGEGAYFAVEAQYSNKLTQPINETQDVMKSLSFGHFIPLTQKSATVSIQNDTSSHNQTNTTTPTDDTTSVNNTQSSIGQTPGNPFGPVSFLASPFPPYPAAQSRTSGFNYFGQQSTSGGGPSTGRKVKLMFMARVVCGRPFQGAKGIRRPPPDISDSKKRLYNSAVNNLNRPDMFIIFDSSQSYPEYVIEYYC